ncbi:hypothetical protein, partial [Capnocytophaga sp. oral taxon 338]|uniref:hypothetical protein n=1 Tax=Capnocytophaga sp. oral taxon 338 TaxID=710239 RepID=UPI000202D6A4
MEYEIASLRYLDALNGQKLLLTPSVIIVDNTLGYKKIGTLENVYITVNNDAKKANIGVYSKGEKVVLSLEKNLKSEIDEIDTFFNTSLSAEVKHLLNQWDDDLLKNLHKDLSSKSTGGELRQLLKAEDDFLKWKLIKEDPAYAFKLSKENSSWTKWGKSNFFKEMTKEGREFESFCLLKLKDKTSDVYMMLKNKIPDLDSRTILSNVKLCISGKYPCKEAGEYFKPDFVAVKKIIDGDVEILDIVIIDSKLSKSTSWTINQTEAQKMFEYIVKSEGKVLQGNLKLNKENLVYRNNSSFVRIYKENDIIKV